jgi:DNA-binding XRE family transcriptional regulator
MTHEIGNYLKVHRKKAGLTQRELGRLIGYDRPWQVSRHEQSHTAPPLLVALAYQEVFQVPVSGIFTGMRGTVGHMIEENIAAFEKEITETNGKGRAAYGIALKLKWLQERNRLT